jgi:TonB family protein
MKYLVIAALILLGSVSLDAQAPAFAPGTGTAGRIAGSITTARELYAAARYDEALAVLNGLSPTEGLPPADRKTIEQYRSLCLLALGRGGEAESAIAAVVRVDPFYQPGEADASPRVRATFADVRQRLLPDLATTRYADAKLAYDRKQFAEAAVRFRELVALLKDPQMNGRLPDLSTLAAGFVELADAAAAPPAPKEEPVAPPPPAQAQVQAEPSREPKIYTSDEPGIVGPVIIRQDVPAMPAAISAMTRNSGVVELVIDEQGRVTSLNLRGRIHPMYDSTLLNAARDWKYQPARLNGTPVRFRKLIQITIRR